MLYLLPTKGVRKYKGKFPNAIHDISLGSVDRDGNICASWETNAGERFTAAYTDMDMPIMNAASRYVGVNWMVFIRGKHARHHHDAGPV